MATPSLSSLVTSLVVKLDSSLSFKAHVKTEWGDMRDPGEHAGAQPPIWHSAHHKEEAAIRRASLHPEVQEEHTRHKVLIWSCISRLMEERLHLLTPLPLYATLAHVHTYSTSLTSPAHSLFTVYLIYYLILVLSCLTITKYIPLSQFRHLCYIHMKSGRQQTANRMSFKWMRAGR